MAFREDLVAEVEDKLRQIELTTSNRERLDLKEDVDKIMEFFAVFSQWKHFHQLEELGVLPSSSLLGRILCRVEYEEGSFTEPNKHTKILEEYWRAELPVYPDPYVVQRIYSNPSVGETRLVRRWIEGHYDLRYSPPLPRPETRVQV